MMKTFMNYIHSHFFPIYLESVQELNIQSLFVSKLRPPTHEMYCVVKVTS